MKKGKARQHFLRSTRLDSEKSGQDLRFLDEGQESLPDESRSEDLFAEGINQDFVDPENTNLCLVSINPRKIGMIGLNDKILFPSRGTQMP
jgi:hypothetical protein